MRRYFLVLYSYRSDRVCGSGNLGLDWDSFPSLSVVRKEIVKQANLQINNTYNDISLAHVVVNQILELNHEDFKLAIQKEETPSPSEIENRP